MSTRRDFLKQSGLALAAFGVGIHLGLGGNEAAPRTSFSALLPENLAGLADLEAWLGAQGLESSRMVRSPFSGNVNCDLVLLRDGKLQDPSNWPAELRRLRKALTSQQAAWQVEWSQEGTPQEATALQITDAKGRCETRALAGFGRQRLHGSGTHELTLEASHSGIRVLQADCRQGICREQAPVRFKGERIVCAPSGLLLELA